MHFFNVYPTNIPKVSTKYPKSIPKVSKKYPQSIPKVYPEVYPKVSRRFKGIFEVCRNVCLASQALEGAFTSYAEMYVLLEGRFLGISCRKCPPVRVAPAFQTGGKGNGMSVGCWPRRLYCDRILMCSGLGLRIGIPISIVLALLISAGRRNRYVLSCFFLVLVLFAAFHQNIL
jgi:hypothetical protein